ncbi:MFS transporter [Sphingomonas sp. S6]|jgi:Na+/melibiose symporter-like transporter|uniref:MFS transporter n=1 Tax=Sphingomonas sp. S6 TaxID=3368600 RepID=UPI000FA07BEC|nr:MFS transporter [uncultured Sphingomonas sp.]RTL16558.1 MAG: hypothetical protein EKK50_10900 [Sphingomonadaceae bacterium]
MTTIPSDPSPSRSHPLAVQVGYSAANMGKSVVWTSFESVLLFYLVSIAGFGPMAAGALLAAALVWDATFDLTVARWTDARGTSAGLAQLVLVGAPLCGIGFWLIFVLQAPAGIAAAIIACRIGYSLCDVGHNTLLIRVAQGPGAAARVSGLRLLFSASGVALLALASGSSLSLATAAAQRQSFAAGALGGGALYVATLFIAIAATRALPATPQRSVATPHPRPLRSYWAHPPFRRLLLLIAVQAALVPLFQRALPFYGAATRGDPAWAGPALLTMTIAQSLALPGWMLLSRRWSPRRIAMAAHGVTALAMVGMTIARAGRLDTVLLAALGIGLAGMNLAIWALLTATVQTAFVGDARGEATPVGLFLAVLKAAAAFGNLMFAAIVAAGPWRLTVPGGAGITLLPLSATVVPIAGCAVSLLLLSRNDRAA